MGFENLEDIMHITLEANYAIQTVEYLSKKYGELQPKDRVNHDNASNAKEIAEATGIPLRFLLKILRKLVAADVLESFRGAKGGYVLAKPPEHITMKEVIEAVEGPYVISRCQKQEYGCGKENCKLHKVYDDISRDIQETLESYTFSRVCSTKAGSSDCTSCSKEK